MQNWCVTISEINVSIVKLSTRAKQGAAVEEQLRKGETISNELLLDIIVEAIR